MTDVFAYLCPSSWVAVDVLPYCPNSLLTDVRWFPWHAAPTQARPEITEGSLWPLFPVRKRPLYRLFLQSVQKRQCKAARLSTWTRNTWNHNVDAVKKSVNSSSILAYQVICGQDLRSNWTRPIWHATRHSYIYGHWFVACLTMMLSSQYDGFYCTILLLPVC